MFLIYSFRKNTLNPDKCFNDVIPVYESYLHTEGCLLPFCLFYCNVALISSALQSATLTFARKSSSPSMTCRLLSRGANEPTKMPKSRACNDQRRYKERKQQCLVTLICWGKGDRNYD